MREVVVESGEVPPGHYTAILWSCLLFSPEVAALLVFKDSRISKGTSEMSEGFSQKPLSDESNRP